MSILGAAGVAGVVKDVVYPVVRDVVKNKAAADAIMRELDLKLVDLDSKIVDGKVKLIQQEMQGTIRQRNWRPDLMYLLMKIMFIYVVLFPVGAYVMQLVSHAFGWSLPVFNYQAIWGTLSDNLFTLLYVSIGGYMASRGAEKLAHSPAFQGGSVRKTMDKAKEVVRSTVGFQDNPNRPVVQPAPRQEYEVSMREEPEQAAPTRYKAEPDDALYPDPFDDAPDKPDTSPAKPVNRRKVGYSD